MIATLSIAAALAGAMPQAKPCLTAIPSPTAAQTAQGKPWFVNNETIGFRGATYGKYGLPRVLAPDEVEPVGDYRGTVVAMPPDSPDASIIYVMSDARCEFQPYVLE